MPLEQAKTLLVRAAMTTHPRTARACLEMLGRGGAAGEALLIETLQHEEADLGLGQAARQAIAEIQSRVEGASPGQLSLAGAEAGQLSLTENPAGQLSLGDDP